jgi:alpha-glucosidase
MRAKFVIGSIAGIAVARAATVDNCPGYKASNVVKGDSYLTADLQLAGTACNVYGDDIEHLKLLVEYQTGVQTSIPRER